ncbi:glutamate-cysteine ligase family protein [Streptomyces sp. NPDC005917]|uniref:glutamate-cysteine ligase family protein n=1 Tax=unclassified Streptomyces TaxID=2593676 RepID=UPI00340C6068
MPRTVEVEEELLLVHPDSGEPVPRSAAVLDRAALEDPGQAVVQKELFGQMLELAEEAVAQVRRRGTGAREQRSLPERTGSLRDVVVWCVRRTQG